MYNFEVSLPRGDFYQLAFFRKNELLPATCAAAQGTTKFSREKRSLATIVSCAMLSNGC